MYYFLPRKSIFVCISTYIHSKIFPCEGSNPARGLKHPNVIPHFFKNYFGIWVAKKPDISGFFLHVILLVMLICKFMTKEMTCDKWLFFELCQNNHIIKIYVPGFSLCEFSSMCVAHGTFLFYGNLPYSVFQRQTLCIQSYLYHFSFIFEDYRLY